ncbi:Innexin inx2 [Amphibalanus amphitrite]|uniref:Innexin n=1 Tax=Amphibalanus amphitrite TaxID=1232801 RepID=A0A6A4WPK5_AMPAM|nr:Innexin inx2 [Amphibalanus amphitrite]
MAAMALESVAQAIQGLGSTRVKIDTGAFSLHYRATTTVFVAFGGLLYTTGLMVDPLQCQPAAGSDGASTPVINAFCWSAGTYSLKPTDGTTEESGIPHGRRHSYYSWAALLLIVQGLLFYLPHWIWNALEGRTIASIVQDTSNRMFDQQRQPLCLANVTQYFRRTRGQHQAYLSFYVACEALNFVNVISSLFLMDAYLGGGFLGYGARVVSHRWVEDQPGPMEEQFPKMTGCRVTLPAADGSDRATTDTICVLTLNALYEKVYLLLWFWLIILSVISGCSLLWRLVTMPIPQLRVAALSRRAPLAHPDDLRDLSDALGLGDLFVLSLVAENVDSGAFQRLAYELADDTDWPASPSERNPSGPTPISDGPCAFKRPDSSSGVFKRPDSTVTPAK